MLPTCEPAKPRPWWIATRSYTAKCPPCPGKVGPPVTITRQFVSYISERDAEDRAMECAKKAAEAALVCRFEAVECVRPICYYGPHSAIVCRTATSDISQSDANLKAIALAQAAADEICASL